jgi:hypothetical protein
MNQGCTLRDPPEKACLFGAKFFAACFALALTTATCKAQAASGQQPSPPATKANPELQVNWLYGAYVPKDVPLHPLSNQQRFQLFLRQSFTTPAFT